MITLDEYVLKNPWLVQWNSLGPPVEYFFRYDVPITHDAMWARMADTSTINERLGLPRMKFTEREGKLYGSYTMAGVVHEWEEVPWQWEYGRDLRAERIYSKGLLHYARVHFFIEETGPSSSRVYVYIGWIPRDLRGRAVLLLARPRYRKKYAKILESFGREEGAPRMDLRLAPDSLPRIMTSGAHSPVNTVRIREIRDSLLGKGLERETVEKLVSYIESAPDTELFRMRPRLLARTMSVREEGLIPAMLHSTREGLLNLAWDVVCPHCQGVRGKTHHLWEVPRIGSCESCGISFETTGLNGIEITFRVSPEIKRVEEVLFCSAEPAKKPHIRIQRVIPPGGAGDAALAFGEGRFRLRMKGRMSYGVLDVREGNEARDAAWDTGMESARLECAPGSVLHMRNLDAVPHTFILEQNRSDDHALRPADIFNIQDFHDLFPEESLPADLSIDVGVQTILFVDIVRSSGLYSREGNARAFAIVRAFFREAHDTARVHSGAIIKTMGDAVLFSFARARDALGAAMDLSSRFGGQDPEEPVSVRISINRGPCLAVNLNSAIDYFGQTVNVAAKLQGCVGAGEIAVAEGVMNDRDVGEYLARKGLDLASPREVQVKGVGAERYWKFRAGRKTPASGGDRGA